MTVECELKKLLTITFSIDNCNEYCYIDINRPARPLVDFVLQRDDAQLAGILLYG